MDSLYPLSLTRSNDTIHTGGFSQQEEEVFGFKKNELFILPTALHELITLHRKNFARNLEFYKKKCLEENKEYNHETPGVFIHQDAKIHDTTVFDTTKGIIVIEKGATINPFAYLVGPLRIDEQAIINPHAFISNSYIGQHSKIGGEVASSVIESYTNKGHYGYVGDSYVGSWVNLGGGTATSNLKNTYGEITMNGIKTGEQFLGAVIADHVKTAGNTSIYTGKIIGIGAHIYGTVTEDVPSFTNYISKNNLVAIPLEVTLSVADRMYARRNKAVMDEDKKMLSYAYTETEKDRKAKGVQEGKLSL